MEFVIRRPSTGETIPLVGWAPASTVRSAKQQKTLMQEDIVTIEIETATAPNVQIGDILNVFGTDYTLNQLPTIKRTGRRNYVATLTFEGLQYGLLDKIFMPPAELGVRGSALCFDLATMLGHILDNANRDRATMRYRLAECPEGTEYKNLSFTDNNCLQALQTCCTEWGVEFRLVQESDAIALFVAEHVGSTTPAINLSYGRGGGLYELQRQKPSGDIITRLYAYGGSDNLMYYRHTRLCLPGLDRWHSYIEDPDAVAMYGLREGVHNFEEIYPQFEGAVTSLGTDYARFKSNDINFDLNAKWAAGDYAEWLALKGLPDTAENRRIFNDDLVNKATKYLTEGATAVVHFQTGALAGYDIDINSFNSSTGEVTLNPLVDENGYEFPSRDNTAFRIAEGDKFIFLGINLPGEWKDQAEQKLQEEAEAYYANACKVQAKYNVEIEPLWLKSQMTGAGTANLFDTGDLVGVTDEPANFAGNIRINAFERDLLDPWAYKLTLTDAVEIRTTTRMAQELQKLTEVVKENDLADPNTKRRAWNVKSELLDMIFDSEGNYYSEKIAPMSIDTQMLKVGARSQQLTLQNFVLETNVPDSTGAPQPDVLRWGESTLLHYTIDPEGVRTWQLAAGSIQLSGSAAAYIYARCSVTGATGSLVIDRTQRVFDEDVAQGYYYFLLGTISSITDGARVASMTYGFTTINGRFVTTGRIQSNDAQTYFDLDAGEIGGNIKFNAGNKEEIERIVNEAVGGMSVGGRNLWKNTREMDRYGIWKESVNNPEINRNITHDGTQYDIFTAGYSEWAWSGWGQVIDAKPNTSYTLGYTMRADTGRYVAYNIFYRFYVNGEWQSYSDYAPPVIFDQWERRHQTVVTPEGCEKLFVSVSSGGTTKWLICAMKMEEGTMATDWSAAPEDADYLAQSLQEATAGTTDITGGLVLSSFLGVRSGSQIVAGMNGNADNDLPMVFAGRDGTAAKGTFQVYQDGRVISQSEDGARVVTINRDEILFSRDGENKNVITSAAQAGIDDMLGSGQTVTDKDAAFVFSDTYFYNMTEFDEIRTDIKPIVQTAEVVASASANGVITIGSFSTTISSGLYAHAIGTTSNTYLSGDGGTGVNLILRVGTRSYALISSYDSFADVEIKGSQRSDRNSESITATYPGGTVAINAGERAYLSLTISPTALVGCDYCDVSADFELSSSVSAFSVHTKTVLENYKNTIFSNGFIFAAKSDSYLAVDPYAQSASNLLKMRQGDQMMATNPWLGLHYSEDAGEHWARGFPLCFVGRVDVSNNIVTNVAAEFNPRGWAFKTGTKAEANAVVVRRTAAGHFTFYHPANGVHISNFIVQRETDGVRFWNIENRLDGQDDIRITNSSAQDRDAPYMWIMIWHLST